MTPDPMYQAIAESTLARCKDYRTTRKILTGFEAELLLAPEEAKAGLRYVVQELGKRLDSQKPPVEVERGG